MAVVWPNSTPIYPTDFALPLVDHIHERHHSVHWPFTNSPGKRDTFYPDADLRDYDTGYTIDLELPGLADPHSVKVEWTSKKDIIVAGCIQRPEVPDMGLHRLSSGGEPKIKKRDKDEPSEVVHWSPTLLVGERKTGNFHRQFHLPVEVDVANLKARLENGLLTIRMEKLKSDQKTTGRAQVE